jgi:dihydropteroate synthase
MPLSDDASPSAANILAQRARRWQIRGQLLALGDRPLLMGILNVTPDSFSDGGRFLEPAAAIEHGLRLASEGAGILDIGGESTRPGSLPVPPDEQLRRVLPVILGLVAQTSVPVSIDTSSAAVARAALDAGACIINDVTGLTGDPTMIEVARSTGCGVCVMHMQGSPRTMQVEPTYKDVVAHVLGYLKERRDALLTAGLRRECLALDPGIGFGKTCAHNLALLRSAWRLHALGCPVLFGPSRKRFIGELLGDGEADRTAGTIGSAIALAEQGVQILRVHDVLAVRQALELYQASRTPPLL